MTVRNEIIAGMIIANKTQDWAAWERLFDATCSIQDPALKADVLHHLLVMPGHEFHQHVTMEIQQMKSPSSILYIRAVLADGFAFLAYTCSEDEAIAKWFSHALASIGTPEAIALIKEFAATGNAGVAREMSYRLRQSAG
jgi:hypothetical protein